MVVEYTPLQRLWLRTAFQAITPVTTSTTLMAASQAFASLADEGVPIPLDKAQEQLLAIIGRAGALGTYQSNRAAVMSNRVLALANGELDEDAAKGIWHHPEFAENQRMTVLATELLAEMAHCLRFRIEQAEWRGGSPRLAWLQIEAASIMGSDSPLDAADLWLNDPPQPPANLDRGPVLVPDVDGPLPGDPGYDKA